MTEKLAARLQITTNLEHYNKILKTAQQELARATQNVDSAKKTLEVVTQQASSYCAERIPKEEIRLTREQIERQIGRMKRELEQMQNKYLAAGVLLMVVLV
jgi:archaellum component FlaC